VKSEEESYKRPSVSEKFKALMAPVASCCLKYIYTTFWSNSWEWRGL